PLNKILESSHIGSDESGTGDFFGPVTAAAVSITQEQIINLNKLGIQDSKLIKDDSILNISKKIVTMNIHYSLLVLNNEKYNQIQQSGWSRSEERRVGKECRV